MLLVASLALPAKQAATAAPVPMITRTPNIPEDSGVTSRLCLQEADERAAEQALMMFREKVRRWLAKMQGYECQVSSLRCL